MIVRLRLVIKHDISDELHNKEVHLKKYVYICFCVAKKVCNCISLN